MTAPHRTERGSGRCPAGAVPAREAPAGPNWAILAIASFWLTIGTAAMWLTAKVSYATSVAAGCAVFLTATVHLALAYEAKR